MQRQRKLAPGMLRWLCNSDEEKRELGEIGLKCKMESEEHRGNLRGYLLMEEKVERGLRKQVTLNGAVNSMLVSGSSEEMNRERLNAGEKVSSYSRTLKLSSVHSLQVSIWMCMVVRKVGIGCFVGSLTANRVFNGNGRG